MVYNRYAKSHTIAPIRPPSLTPSRHFVRPFSDLFALLWPKFTTGLRIAAPYLTPFDHLLHQVSHHAADFISTLGTHTRTIWQHRNVVSLFDHNEAIDLHNPLLKKVISLFSMNANDFFLNCRPKWQRVQHICLRNSHFFGPFATSFFALLSHSLLAWIIWDILVYLTSLWGHFFLFSLFLCWAATQSHTTTHSLPSLGTKSLTGSFYTEQMVGFLWWILSLFAHSHAPWFSLSFLSVSDNHLSFLFFQCLFDLSIFWQE